MDARRRRKLDRAVLLTATALLGGAMLAACATPDTIDGSGGSTSGGSGSGTSEGGGTGGGGSTGGGGNSGGGTGGSGTGGGGTGGGGTGRGGGGSAPKPAVYAFELPPSDRSPTITDGYVYSELRSSCDAGQAALDSKRPTEYGRASYGFSGPQFAMLAMAGIAACRGDTATARTWMDHARDWYGLAGIAIPDNVNASPGDFSCFLYQGVWSVLEQRPADEFICPGGDIPKWHTSEGDTIFPSSDAFVDDPLTPDVDESIPPTPKETGSPGGTDPGTGTTDGGTGGTDGTGGTGTGTDGEGGAETAPPTGGSG